MHREFTVPWFCRVVGIALLAGTAAAAEPAGLGSLRSILSAHMAEIEGVGNTEANAWAQDYRRDVAQLGIACQRAGDLEGWQAATQETARFAATPQLPDATPETVPDGLRTLQARYRTAAAQRTLRQARKVVDLTSKYLARLATLQAEATRGGNLEEALAYNAETKRVQALPAVAKAQADVAAPPPAAPAVPEAPPAAPVATPTVDAAVPDGVQIAEGLTPPAVPGLTFKPVALTVTDRMRVARSLSVQAELATSSEMQRTSYSRSGSMHHVLRLGLRSASTSQGFEGTKLLAEFYGRDLGGRGSHIVPKPLGTQVVDLPKLDGARWVFVQLPRVSAESSDYRGGYYYGTSRYGMEFYGVVVSVFDASDALVYQAVSAANLLDVAPAKMPPNVEHLRALSAAQRRFAAAAAALRAQTGGDPEAADATAGPAFVEYQRAVAEYERIQASPDAR